MSEINIEKLISGERRSLAKAITLLESQNKEDQVKSNELITKILDKTGKAIRLGISGAPGVGKSTFIESLGILLLNQGRKVAVLAIDPSSPIHGGSILGDKTRMEKLSIHQNAFIRPTPSKCKLGGVASRTYETILLCEAAGFDTIIIETVGVGQSEVDVKNMTDHFSVLISPKAGDELQGIKKGIIEISDTIIVNKNDGELKKHAKQTANEYQNALNVSQNEHKTIFTCSALENNNIDKFWDHIQNSLENNQIELKRTKQRSEYLNKLILDIIQFKLNNSEFSNLNFKELIKKVEGNTISPLEAATIITDEINF
ncbi:MAG: methylmalonyl Co-A mutase-associated GTPase MeaB [Bdellovibrionales bacterium]|jgi:LAO/AO transport system kinase|nr:methylmalonyl Co-A mutase-associated GTPase MeaB [Bdellovibrionales bacterium]